MTEPLSGRQQVMSRLMRLLWAAALVLPVVGAQAGVVFTTLYSFTGTNDGYGGPSGLVQGKDGSFYGSTCLGGTTNYNPITLSYGYGTVFKISTNGTLTSLASFTSDNEYPNRLVQGNDGSFYGTTFGSDSSPGTVFKMSTDGALTTLYSFTGGNDGANPWAGLLQGSDGYFYGTTAWGGTNDAGTVFKISTNGALTSLYSFGSVFPVDGENPLGELVRGDDGYFYGTTAWGGTNDAGTVFKISTNGVLTTLHSFGSIQDTNGVPLDGANPWAGLVQGSDGNFYGTTSSGGTNGGWGTVFEISANGALTSLYSFTRGNDGYFPRCGLVQGSDGSFYGTAYYVGFGSCPGTVFRISTNGTLTSLYSFTGGNDGFGPSGLVQGSDGSFYGTTWLGGTNGGGTIFRLTIVPDPQLTMIPSGPYVIFTWPTNYSGFTLQSTTNLGSSAVWSTNSSSPVVIGGENVVINTMSGRQQFYRLSQ